MTDKIMAILALATMIAFLGVVAVFVPDVDLIVVITFVTDTRAPKFISSRHSLKLGSNNLRPVRAIHAPAPVAMLPTTAPIASPFAPNPR